MKQLGLTHYVYPGALHTRFHHALGAMHLMIQAIKVLQQKDIEITQEEAEAASQALETEARTRKQAANREKQRERLRNKQGSKNDGDKQRQPA